MSKQSEQKLINKTMELEMKLKNDIFMDIIIFTIIKFHYLNLIHVILILID